MSGAQMLVQVLADEGVTRHFRLQRRGHSAHLRRRILFNEQAQAQGTPQVPLDRSRQ